MHKSKQAACGNDARPKQRHPSEFAFRPYAKTVHEYMHSHPTSSRQTDDVRQPALSQEHAPRACGANKREAQSRTNPHKDPRKRADSPADAGCKTCTACRRLHALRPVPPHSPAPATRPCNDAATSSNG
eukprot:6214654-Pleurochrysis_carterae.AAC.4